MPQKGIEHRGNQLARLAGLHHQHATDPRMGALLQELESSDGQGPPGM